MEYEGAICHAMNRGFRREPIFWNGQNRVPFLEMR
jgi:hypothetical protein